MSVGQARLARVKTDLSRIFDDMRDLAASDPDFLTKARVLATQFETVSSHLRQIADDVVATR